MTFGFPAPSKLVYVYVGKWMIPPSCLPTQADNVLSPKNLSVDGYWIWTLKMLCHSYCCFGASHLNQPLKAYSCGNLGFFVVPTIERTSLVSGSLYDGFETTL